MVDSNDTDTDGSAIEPVSSLRSHFESMAAFGPKPAVLINPQIQRRHSRAASADLLQRTTPLPLSLDIPRSVSPRSETSKLHDDTTILRPQKSYKRAPTPPPTRRPRSSHPSSRPPSPPRVDVTSPKSPPRFIELPLPAPLPLQHHRAPTPSSLPPDATHPSTTRSFKIPSRSPSPQKRSPSPSVQASDYPQTAFTGKVPHTDVSEKRAGTSKGPPPVNRAAKPRIPSAERSVENRPGYFPNSESMAGNNSQTVSPFNTPPSGGERTPSREGSLATPSQVKPLGLVGNAPITARHDSPSTRETELRGSFDLKPNTSEGLNTLSYKKASLSLEDFKPVLPPRRDPPLAQLHTQDMSVRKSFDTPSRFSALSQGFSTSISSPHSIVSKTPTTGVTLATREIKPPPQPARLTTNVQTSTLATQDVRIRTSMDYVESPFIADAGMTSATEYPDLSRANRKPPHYPDGPRMIPTGTEARLFDVCGEHVCTTGLTTRVWSLLSGKLLLSMPHGDGVRIASICFKPSRKLEDEGARLWLGTNWGEIIEVDIASKRTNATNSTAHSRHEVIGIYRHATELWTLDDEGKLCVWPSDDRGSSNLDHHVFTGRVGRRPSASVVVAKELWLAFGKEIKIFTPSHQPEDPSFADMQPILHLEAGDISSATIIPIHPDRVYFGHADGKVSIYSCKSRSCIEVVNVSIYRINTLVGAGSYLWAGFYTGMIFVYDISATPWVVKKDWRAHSSPVWSLVADKSSIWKLDRLQVLSLGTDNVIGVWDGLLKNDWLENDMHSHDKEFCTFREISAVVMTWNAGATKPADLRHDEQNANFFRELFVVKNPPEILVFSLQELVDLENKKATARSFFKSKKSDEYGHEQLSSVYRAWKNYFSDCLVEYMPASHNYALLHSASLVGLFTCIFINTSERGRIKNVQAAEIKTGLGGLHGNKGALIVRFTLDDSSLCFINCHLAAGQSQTLNRNNDVASILEGAPLPGHQLPVSQSETFVSGGDGTMVLDHEICVLNGDLNYRIEGMPRDTVVHALKSKDLSKLLERDQLLMQCRKSPGFRLRAFHEAPITFEPTYKYDNGTDNYDSSEKKRIPAWCDRILYRGGDKIRQTEYRRHEVRVSDHRPVSGLFVLRIKTVKADKRLEVWRRSEQRFQQEKREVSTSAKLDYLQGVFGVSEVEAQKLLGGR